MDFIQQKEIEGLPGALEHLEERIEVVEARPAGVIDWTDRMDIPAGVTFTLYGTLWRTRQWIPAGTDAPPYAPNWPDLFEPHRARPDQETATRLDGFDTSLAGKAAIVHFHDDRYYTKQQVDAQLLSLSQAVHNHDDRYYTEAEIDQALAPIRAIIGNEAGDGDTFINTLQEVLRVFGNSQEGFDILQALAGKANAADLTRYLPLAGNTPATPLGSLYWGANAAISYVGNTLLLTNGRTVQISENGLTIARPGVATVTLDTNEQGQLLVNGSRLNPEGDGFGLDWTKAYRVTSYATTQTAPTVRAFSLEYAPGGSGENSFCLLEGGQPVGTTITVRVPAGFAPVTLFAYGGNYPGIDGRDNFYDSNPPPQPVTGRYFLQPGDLMQVVYRGDGRWETWHSYGPSFTPTGDGEGSYAGQAFESIDVATDLNSGNTTATFIRGNGSAQTIPLGNNTPGAGSGATELQIDSTSARRVRTIRITASAQVLSARLDTNAQALSYQVNRYSGGGWVAGTERTTLADVNSDLAALTAAELAASPAPELLLKTTAIDNATDAVVLVTLQHNG